MPPISETDKPVSAEDTISSKNETSEAIFTENDTK